MRQLDDFGSAVLKLGSHPGTSGQRTCNGKTTEKVCRLLKQTPQELGDAFAELKGSKQLFGFAGVWVSKNGLQSLKPRFVDALSRLHERNPSQSHFSAAQLAKEAGLAWDPKAITRLASLLKEEGLVEVNERGIRLVNSAIQLSPRQEALLARVLEELEREAVNVPTPHQIAQILGVPRQAIEAALDLGIHSGRLIKLDETVFYTPRQVEALRAKVTGVNKRANWTLPELRDALETTRKYAVPLMIYFGLDQPPS